MAYFLRSATGYKERNVVNMRVIEDDSLVLPFPPRFLEVHPNSLFLYSDFVDTTNVAGKSLRLMKILPGCYSDVELGKTSSNTKNYSIFKPSSFIMLQGPPYISGCFSSLQGLKSVKIYMKDPVH